MNQHNWATKIYTDSKDAMELLIEARQNGRPVVLLTGAGISVDSGFPLTSELKEYLVQVREYVSLQGFSNVRQYVEEARWPSRHDLRIDLMLKLQTLQLEGGMQEAERRATQASLIAELRGEAPTLAFSLEEIFAQMDSSNRRIAEYKELYSSVESIAKSLGRRSPRNVGYRSMLYNLCDDNQATIDA